MLQKQQHPILRGRFASECDWHPKAYCKGTCMVELLDNDVFDGAKGRITIEYDADSTFQPPFFVPRPLPSMPVTVERLPDAKYMLRVKSHWFSWERIFDLIGLSVTFTLDENSKDFSGTYNVSGGIGIPKDAGVLSGGREE